MTEIYSVDIYANDAKIQYEKNFPASMTLLDVKNKLELVVGAMAEDIQCDLLDNDGKIVGSLSDDTKTIKELGVRSGMRIRAFDSTGQNEDLKDESMVEKYTMSDDKYNLREDSVRALKLKKMAEQGITPGEKSTSQLAEEKAAENIKVGNRCEVRTAREAGMPRRGEVAFVGKTEFSSGIWVGIKYDEPVGKNDGSVDGVRYFTTDSKYGGFARPQCVIVGDYPEIGIDEM